MDVDESEDAHGLKLAENQSIFRVANEGMEKAAASHHFARDQGVPFLCECADPACREIVMLSLEDYERVRAQPSWFLLVAGHEDAEAAYERIVEAEHGYAIVEKIGATGIEAARLNPRAGRVR